ncbi:unannotated protein [freshwater metagenome]|uniref:Unannotated protein n=1 Tax=freshwater metagenome TaxID=449393 RepID=A0A6J7W382_9ZZZZ
MSANERVRLAQELHDGIAQDLVGLGYSIDSLIGSPELTSEIRASLRALRFSLTDLVEKVRREIFALRSNDTIMESAYISSTNYELQRIFAELIRNIQLHSEATSLTIKVGDNGRGGASPALGHHGLSGISERVLALHGTVDIDSSASGTVITIALPLAVQ